MHMHVSDAPRLPLSRELCANSLPEETCRDSGLLAHQDLATDASDETTAIVICLGQTYYLSFPWPYPQTPAAGRKGRPAGVGGE
jgi:hypothetical protein